MGQPLELGGRFTTINGVVLPIITLRPGEVQRWRFIHSGIHESLTLRLDGHPLHEIAADGIPLGKMAAWQVDPDVSPPAMTPRYPVVLNRRVALATDRKKCFKMKVTSQKSQDCSFD